MDQPKVGAKNVPPYSRLFVVCGKKCNVEELKDTFSQYGNILSCQIALDRAKKSRGFAFIQYDAASSAALAIEEVHMRLNPDGSMFKVMIAENQPRENKQKSLSNKSQGKRQRPHTPTTSLQAWQSRPLWPFQQHVEDQWRLIPLYKERNGNVYYPYSNPQLCTQQPKKSHNELKATADQHNLADSPSHLPLHPDRNERLIMGIAELSQTQKNRKVVHRRDEDETLKEKTNPPVSSHAPTLTQKDPPVSSDAPTLTQKDPPVSSDAPTLTQKDPQPPSSQVQKVRHHLPMEHINGKVECAKGKNDPARAKGELCSGVVESIKGKGEPNSGEVEPDRGKGEKTIGDHVEPDRGKSESSSDNVEPSSDRIQSCVEEESVVKVKEDLLEKEYSPSHHRYLKEKQQQLQLQENKLISLPQNDNVESIECGKSESASKRRRRVAGSNRGTRSVSIDIPISRTLLNEHRRVIESTFLSKNSDHYYLEKGGLSSNEESQRQSQSCGEFDQSRHSVEKEKKFSHKKKKKIYLGQYKNSSTKDAANENRNCSRMLLNTSMGQDEIGDNWKKVETSFQQKTIQETQMSSLNVVVVPDRNVFVESLKRNSVQEGKKVKKGNLTSSEEIVQESSVSLDLGDYESTTLGGKYAEGTPSKRKHSLDTEEKNILDRDSTSRIVSSEIPSRKHVEKRSLSPGASKSMGGAKDDCFPKSKATGNKRHCNTNLELEEISDTSTCYDTKKKGKKKEEGNVDLIIQGALKATKSLYIHGVDEKKNSDGSLSSKKASIVNTTTTTTTTNNNNNIGDIDKPPRSRVFIVSTEKYTQQELYAMFGAYGNLEYVQLVKSHGKIGTMAYAKYCKTSTAAAVIESFQESGDDEDSIIVTLADPKTGPERSNSPILLDPYDPTLASSSLAYSKSLRKKSSVHSCSSSSMKNRWVASSTPLPRKSSPTSKLSSSCLSSMHSTCLNSKVESLDDDEDEEDDDNQCTYESTGFSQANEELESPDDEFECLVHCGGNTSIEELKKLFHSFPGISHVDVRYNEFEGLFRVSFDSQQAVDEARKTFDHLEFPPHSGQYLQVIPSYPLGYSPPPYHHRELALPDDLDIKAVEDQFAHMMSENPPYLTPPTIPLYPPPFPTPPVLQPYPGHPPYLGGYVTPPYIYPSLHPTTPPPMPPIFLGNNPRLFVVCSGILPEGVFKGVFEDFGAVESIRFEKDKNYGYVKFYRRESAFAAIEYLNGARIEGHIVTVMIVDPPSGRRKRPRIDHPAKSVELLQ